MNSSGDFKTGAPSFFACMSMPNVLVAFVANLSEDTNWDFKQESNFQYLFGVKDWSHRAPLVALTDPIPSLASLILSQTMRV